MLSVEKRIRLFKTNLNVYKTKKNNSNPQQSSIAFDSQIKVALWLKRYKNVRTVTLI